MDGGKDAATATAEPVLAEPTVAGAGAPETTDAAPAAATTASAAAPGGQGKVVAPPLSGRVSYVFGGTMPPRYRDWVLRDLTTPGWRWRQALRPVLMALPVAVIFALLPGPLGTRAMLVGFLLVAPFVLGLALSNNFRQRRLVAHGFPAPAKSASEDAVAAFGPASAGSAPARPTAEAPSAAPTADLPGELDDDPDGINA
jgi:hypothetical protein